MRGQLLAVARLIGPAIAALIAAATPVHAQTDPPGGGAEEVMVTPPPDPGAAAGAPAPPPAPPPAPAEKKAPATPAEKKPPAGYVPGTGFVIQSDDAAYRLRVGLQAAYKFEPVYQDGDFQDRNTFFVLRPIMSGNFLREWIHFWTSFEFAANPPYLLDSYIEIFPWKEFGLRIGQQFTPYDRHEYFGPQEILFPEWAPVSEYFWPGRDKGVTAMGTLAEQLEYWLGVYSGTPLRQFNAGAFLGPVVGSDGLESGNGYLRGCFISSTDVAIARTIKLGAGRSLQLRADVFNLFNQAGIIARNTTMNLTSPSDPATVTNLPFDASGAPVAARARPNGAGFGVATDYQPPRSIQLQARFAF